MSDQKAFLLIGVAALAIAHGAAAQEAAPTASQNAETVDTIVVTANKREERLQDVPITVSVVGGDQLTRQNVSEVTDLSRSTPALSVPGPFGALAIRGVGAVSFSRSAEGSVGVVVDGVALANTSANPPQLFDVARVEVLEGPQGTLFGRNSSAGVLNIVTNAPSFSGFSVASHADVASRDDRVGRLVANLPLSSTAALRLSGSYSHSPDTQTNVRDGSDYNIEGKSVRGRLLWEPSSSVSINLIADYSQFDRVGGVPWTVYKSTPGSLLTSRLSACGVVVRSDNQQGCIDGTTDTTSKSSGVSGQVDWMLGDYTVTSITAFRKFTQDSVGSDADSVPVNRLNVNDSLYDVKNVSQELRLSSPTSGRVEFVTGLYYFNSDLTASNNQLGYIAADGGVPYPLGQRLDTQSQTLSYAAFVQSTVHLTGTLRLILGGRVGSEKVKANTVGRTATGALAPFAAIGKVSGKIQDGYVTYRIGGQYDLTDHMMGYLTYTKGYKGPAINDQTLGPNVPVIVRPEIPKAWELGVKSSILEGRLAANLTLFDTTIDDFQAQFFDPSVSQYVAGNAPKMTTKGVSANVFGRLAPGLTVNVGAIYNDAKYGDGYVVTCSQLQTAAQGCVTQGVVSGKTITGDDAGGNRLVGAPKIKVTSQVEYAHDLDGTVEGFIQADAVYTSRLYFNAAYDPLNSVGAATIFGGRVGVRSQDQRYSVALFARNLFDTYRPIVRFATPTAAQQGDPSSYSQISGSESRRLVGISLDAKF